MSGRLRIALAALLLCLAPGLPAWGQDKELSPESTLAGVLERGKLRVCFEAGYLPFEMVGT
ncbi:MAG: hypothetical protein R3322_22715, partial [Kiloniellales bacterium]|nr:hypothetical protein [Kiloniellales bacterium]